MLAFTLLFDSDPLGKGTVAYAHLVQSKKANFLSLFTHG